MTVCNTCQVDKDDSSFPQCHGVRYGRKCKACKWARTLARRAVDPTLLDAARKASRECMARRRVDPVKGEQVREVERTRGRESYDPVVAKAKRDANKGRWKKMDAEYHRAKSKEHYSNNKAAYAAKDIVRRRTIKDRTFGSEPHINNVYRNCPIGYHVDHIVPLQGELVSGLHVWWNLQYLTASENISKHNKFSPDSYSAWQESGEVGTFLG